MAAEGFEEPLKLHALMDAFARPWFIAGGWAVDLFINRVTRKHQDLEIAVFRDDQTAVRDHLAGWEFSKAVDEGMEPWHEGERLELPVHEIHAQNSAGEPRSLEILLNETDGERWLYRRNLQIRFPLDRVGVETRLRLPVLSPEIVLLYKATRPGLTTRRTSTTCLASWTTKPGSGSGTGSQPATRAIRGSPPSTVTNDRRALGDSGERVAAAHLCAPGQAYGDPAGMDDPG